MMIKVADTWDIFTSVCLSFQNTIFTRQGDVHYIGGTEVLPLCGTKTRKASPNRSQGTELTRMRNLC